MKKVTVCSSLDTPLGNLVTSTVRREVYSIARRSVSPRINDVHDELYFFMQSKVVGV